MNRTTQRRRERSRLKAKKRMETIEAKEQKNKNSLKEMPAVSIKQAALLLRKSGSRIATVEQIKKDIENGAPVNSDGSISMLKYVSWLALQLLNR